MRTTKALSIVRVRLNTFAHHDRRRRRKILNRSVLEQLGKATVRRERFKPLDSPATLREVLRSRGLKHRQRHNVRSIDFGARGLAVGEAADPCVLHQEVVSYVFSAQIFSTGSFGDVCRRSHCFMRKQRSGDDITESDSGG